MQAARGICECMCDYACVSKFMPVHACVCMLCMCVRVHVCVDVCMRVYILRSIICMACTCANMC